MPRTKQDGAECAAMGSRLSTALELLGLDVPQAAKWMGLKTASSVRAALQGKARLDLDRLRILVRKRTSHDERLNLDWLITGEGPPLLAPLKSNQMIAMHLPPTELRTLSAAVSRALKGSGKDDAA